MRPIAAGGGYLLVDGIRSGDGAARVSAILAAIRMSLDTCRVLLVALLRLRCAFCIAPPPLRSRLPNVRSC